MGFGQNLPKRVNDGKAVITWQSFSPCHKSDCPISPSCPYPGKSNRCEVEVKFIQCAIKAIIDANQLTETQVHHAGVALMPLYSHLVRFKLVEYSLKTPTINNGKGIHPIYKEIRETVKTINKIWTDLFRIETKSAVPDLGEMLEHGDPEYIKNLYKERKPLPRSH